MTTIQSVSGPLEAEKLGRVLMHEHVFILDPDFLINYPELDGFDEDRHIPDAITRLNELKAGGIDTIVDLTVLGIGRNIARIQTVQAETDLQILVATGLYTFNEVPHVVHIRDSRTPVARPPYSPRCSWATSPTGSPAPAYGRPSSNVPLINRG